MMPVQYSKPAAMLHRIGEALNDDIKAWDLDPHPCPLELYDALLEITDTDGEAYEIRITRVTSRASG